MKTYENNMELINAMLDIDVNDVADMVSHGLDDADDFPTTAAKVVCNIATRFVENAGGEGRFDVDAIAADDKLNDIVGQFGNALIDLWELIISHGEITGIEVLNEEE